VLGVWLLHNQMRRLAGIAALTEQRPPQRRDDLRVVRVL
jgi:hypothetical protein